MVTGVKGALAPTIRICIDCAEKDNGAIDTGLAMDCRARQWDNRCAGDIPSSESPTAAVMAHPTNPRAGSRKSTVGPSGQRYRLQIHIRVTYLGGFVNLSDRLREQPIVGERGLEPLHPYGHRNLNPARLPIPPLARSSSSG